MSRKKTWTDEAMVVAVRDNISIRGVLKSVGLSYTGSNYQTVKSAVMRLGMDMSHFKGQGYLRGKTHDWTPKRSLQDVLVAGSRVSRNNVKRRLLREGLLKNECSLCGQKGEWVGKPLMMVLDHINGANDDYRLGNLRMLCPNCNSQTLTFASRNRRTCDYGMVRKMVLEMGTRVTAEKLNLRQNNVQRIVRTVV